MKILSNIFTLVGCTFVARIIAFIATMYLTRSLGPEGFGIVGFALAFCSYFYMPISLSMNDIGSREVARFPHYHVDVAAGVVYIKLVLTFIVLSIITLVVFYIELPEFTKWVILLTSLSFLSHAFDTSWVYKGLERNLMVGIALIIAQGVYAVGVTNMVGGSNDVKLVPLFQVLGEMAAALFLARQLFRYGIKHIDFKEGFRIFRSSFYLVGARFSRSIILSFDVLLLGFIQGDKEVGLYTAAYRFCFFLMVIAEGIQVSYLPVFSRISLEKNKAEKLTKIAEKAQELTAVICAPLVVGGAMLAGDILEMLFGISFSEASIAFRWLMVSIGFVFFSGITHNIFMVCERLRVEMTIIAFAATISILLNIILVPVYGMSGSAFTIASVNAFTFFISIIVIFKFKVKIKLKPLIKPFYASGVMGVALFYFSQFNQLLVNIALGCVVYLLALIVIDGFPVDVKNRIRLFDFNNKWSKKKNNS